jgi:opacity protein-like surface antigen
MKKSILAIAVAILCITTGLSQEKGFVALSVGHSAALGDFGSKDPNNKDAGLAKSGVSYDLSLGYKLNKNLGITALYRLQGHEIDGQVLANQLSSQLPAGLTGTVETSGYAISSFLVGGYGSFEIAEKLNLEPRILIGYASINFPSINYKFNNGLVVNQSSVTGSDFGWLIGTGIKYNFDNHWCFLANLDYTSANVDIKNVVTSSNTGSSSKNNLTIKFSSFNSNIGIGYRF